jgi:uncharacterized membrane protein YgcG
MIARILIPANVLPASADGMAPPRRATTPLDARHLVPLDLPAGPLDVRSHIPAHVPLGVLRQRQLVPRDLPPGPLQAQSELAAHLPINVLDSRVVVPREALPPALEIRARPLEELPEVVDRDVFTAGRVNLLTRAVVERATGIHLRENWQAVVSSVAFHAALIALVLLQPGWFPLRPPTAEQMELASKSLGMIYLPPGSPLAPPAPVIPPRTSPNIRIDPRVLRQIVPPNLEPEPLPGTPLPPQVTRELPQEPPPAEPQPAPEGRRAAPRFEEPPDPSKTAQRSPFALQGVSPGRALEDSLKGVTRGGGQTSGSFGGSLPSGPSAGGGGSGGGGGGSGQAYGALELLTPTEGVDFTHYLQRVLASVRRNWYAVIPESAYLGERGKVVLQFRIMKNGSVPSGEPVLVRTSGKNPLDFAAMSSIRASNPFEPLPAAFSGPFIELRFIFLYNLPLDAP